MQTARKNPRGRASMTSPTHDWILLEDLVVIEDLLLEEERYIGVDIMQVRIFRL
jgi:hypothetical protein